MLPEFPGMECFLPLSLLVKAWNRVWVPYFFAFILMVYCMHLLSLALAARLADFFVGALVYADDIVLLSPTASGMRSLLRLCDTFASDFSVVAKPNVCGLKLGAILLHTVIMPPVFWLVVMSLSLSAVGRISVIYWPLIWMIGVILIKGSIRFVVKLMMCCVISVKGSPLSNYSWWKYIAAVFMVLYFGI